MFKNLLLIVLSLVILGNISTPASAQRVTGPNPDTINIGNQLNGKNFGVPAAPGTGIIGTTVKNVISLFFVFGGIATLIYFVWGAFDWITSGGDKEKVAGARKKMTNAIIGLILLALSYFIVGLVGEVVGFNPLQQLDIRSLGEQ